MKHDWLTLGALVCFSSAFALMLAILFGWIGKAR